MPQTQPASAESTVYKGRESGESVKIYQRRTGEDSAQTRAVLHAKKKCCDNERESLWHQRARAPKLPNDKRMPSVQDNPLQRLVKSKQNQQNSYGC